jgi:hypothetical protein
MNPQQVIDEARPMLEDILSQIGLHRSNEPLNLVALREPFSIWLQSQEVGKDDFAFMVSLVAAYICEYLKDTRGASTQIFENRIFLRLSFEDGIVREFDPYSTASGLVQNKQSLSVFLGSI